MFIEVHKYHDQHEAVLLNSRNIKGVTSSTEGTYLWLYEILEVDNKPAYFVAQESYEQIRDMLMNPESSECAPQATGDFVG